MAERVALRPLSDSQREALETAVARYEEAFTADAARYLEARGIASEVADMFRLGVVDDPLPGHNKFSGWLAIPYLRRDGQPLSIRFRCINPACGVLYRRKLPGDPKEHHEGHGKRKYMSMQDEPARVFNVGAIHRATDTIHVAEGEFDAMVLETIGLPAVAIPGASGWAAHHRRMLAGFRRVHVWGDPDDAGADFINRVCRSMRQARGVQLRIGDVSDTYLEYGPSGLLQLIEEDK